MEARVMLSEVCVDNLTNVCEKLKKPSTWRAIVYRDEGDGFITMWIEDPLDEPCTIFMEINPEEAAFLGQALINLAR